MYTLKFLLHVKHMLAHRTLASSRDVVYDSRKRLLPLTFKRASSANNHVSCFCPFPFFDAHKCPDVTRSLSLPNSIDGATGSLTKELGESDFVLVHGLEIEHTD